MSGSDPFYSPDYFQFQQEILLLESDDPEEHAQGVLLLTQQAQAGNADAMAVLGRHFYSGQYRDMYLSLRWYICAAQQKHWEGLSKVMRLYADPEDGQTRQAVIRLKAEGWSDDRIRRLCRPQPEEE